MRINENHSGSMRLLIEFILCLLIFCLCSGICIRIFAQAYQIEQDSQDRNQSVNIIASLAEEYRRKEDWSSAYCISYDSKWKPCHDSDADYQLEITPNPDSPTQEVTFTMIRAHDHQMLYTLTCTNGGDYL